MKKHKLEGEFLRSLKEEESKTLMKIDQVNKNRMERLEKLSRDTALKQTAFMGDSPSRKAGSLLEESMAVSQSQFFGAGLVPEEKRTRLQQVIDY